MCTHRSHKLTNCTFIPGHHVSSFQLPNFFWMPWEGFHQVASLKNSDIFTSQRTGHSRTDPIQCSYTLYDHCRELQKAGSRIASKFFFCRGCKIPVEKGTLHKCQTCGTSVTRSQSWLLAALAGGFNELQGEPSHIISRSTDHKTAAKIG